MGRPSLSEDAAGLPAGCSARRLRSKRGAGSLRGCGWSSSGWCGGGASAAASVRAAASGPGGSTLEEPAVAIATPDAACCSVASWCRAGAVIWKAFTLSVAPSAVPPVLSYEPAKKPSL